MTLEPRFSTKWEREDYERQKRGLPALGPLGGETMNITDEQVIAALRAWWNLEQNDLLPWEKEERNPTKEQNERFRVNSMRDMRAALEAAKFPRLSTKRKVESLCAHKV